MRGLSLLIWHNESMSEKFIAVFNIQPMSFFADLLNAVAI